MTCNITWAYFTVNGLNPKGCIAGSNSNVQVETYVEFSADMVGQQYKAGMKFRMPSGGEYEVFTPLKVVSYGEYFTSDSFATPIPYGAYDVVWITIYDSIGNTVCSGIPGLGQCQRLYIQDFAEFVCNSLTITPSSVMSGEFQQIRALIENVGNKADTLDVYVFIDGVVATIISMTIQPSEIQELIWDFRVVEVGNHTSDILNCSAPFTVIESNVAVVNVYRVLGAGSINVYANGVLIGVVTEAQNGGAFTFNIGDTFKFEAIPASGWQFQQFCDVDQIPCPISGTPNPFTGSIVSSGNVFVWFEQTQTTHKECVNGVCTAIMGVGEDLCSTIGQSCSLLDKYYDCIDGKCTEVANSAPYKNDPTCAGLCQIVAIEDNTLYYILGGAGIVGLVYILVSKTVKL